MVWRGRRIGIKRGERGASLVEYALLVALIAVVCIGAVTYFGQADANKLQKAGDTIGTDGAKRPCAEIPDFNPGGGGTPVTIHYFTDEQPPVTVPGGCP